VGGGSREEVVEDEEEGCEEDVEVAEVESEEEKEEGEGAEGEEEDEEEGLLCLLYRRYAPNATAAPTTPATANDCQGQPAGRVGAIDLPNITVWDWVGRGECECEEVCMVEDRMLAVKEEEESAAASGWKGSMPTTCLLLHQV
jgi:hypothetical protein